MKFYFKIFSRLGKYCQKTLGSKMFGLTLYIKNSAFDGIQPVHMTAIKVYESTTQAGRQMPSEIKRTR